MSDPLQARVDEIIDRYLPRSEELLGWVAVLEASPLFGPVETFETPFEQLLDAEGLAERVGTISYVARLPERERAEVLARVQALGEAQPESPFPFRYRTYARVCATLPVS